MSKATTQAQTVMKGDGFYDRHSSLQRAILDPVLKMASSILPNLPDQSPLTIVDYGASEGANSVFILDKLLTAIWQRHAGQVVNIIHEDQYRNNFNQLFRNVYESKTDNYATQLLNDEAERKLFVFASGCSFYNQIAADASIDLSMCSSAAHWLPDAPAPKNHTYLSGADQEEQRLLSEAAARAWERFLTLRARELKTGGYLIVSMGAALDHSLQGTDIPSQFNDGSELPAPSGRFTCEPLMNLMHAEISRLISEARIDHEKYTRFFIPLYARSYDEILVPLEDRQSSVFGAFDVEHVWVQLILDPMLARFGKTKNAHAYATELVRTMQAFCEPLLLTGLFEIGDARGQDTVNLLFERMFAKILDAPDLYPFSPVNSYTLLRRTELKLS